MSKPLALTAALLLLAGCTASNPTEPATTAGPSFLNNATGCATAITATDAHPGAGYVAVACTKGQGQ
jgi:uncharacterized lipoprotein YajG